MRKIFARLTKNHATSRPMLKTLTNIKMKTFKSKRPSLMDFFRQNYKNYATLSDEQIRLKWQVDFSRLYRKMNEKNHFKVYFYEMPKPPQLFVRKAIEGDYHGAIARKNIAKGQVIFKESPLFIADKLIGQHDSFFLEWAISILGIFLDKKYAQKMRDKMEQSLRLLAFCYPRTSDDTSEDTLLKLMTLTQKLRMNAFSHKNYGGVFFFYLSACNHLCTPNAHVKDGQLIALRNIKKGEEITIRYTSQRENLQYLGIECICNGYNCNGL